MLIWIDMATISPLFHKELDNNFLQDSNQTGSNVCEEVRTSEADDICDAYPDIVRSLASDFGSSIRSCATSDGRQDPEPGSRTALDGGQDHCSEQEWQDEMDAAGNPEQTSTSRYEDPVRIPTKLEIHQATRLHPKFERTNYLSRSDRAFIQRLGIILFIYGY